MNVNLPYVLRACCFCVSFSHWYLANHTIRLLFCFITSVLFTLNESKTMLLHLKMRKMRLKYWQRTSCEIVRHHHHHFHFGMPERKKRWIR